ncbi:MAG: DUF4157 domain-containing protein [Daejeonella sp.]|uniref:eCIS core domain-containing protein n=1 Tax=Daejeonella sp. TaxID=2805397 RepID=UPI0027346328|nr:DUF4157 domain-containing protein [Daejeonella sp.]MDP3469566.1 DUF4157 domain-containing protein [Daejeonella sp.]
MNIHTAERSKNTGSAVANQVTQKRQADSSALQETQVQTEVSRVDVNASPRVAQLRAYQEMANASPALSRLNDLQTIANKSAGQTVQAKTKPDRKKENNTGLPDDLKSGIENLSGYSMDAVKVHYNSPKPAQLQAHAYAQGTDIHLATGQERHLPHEAWHVVQQRQGRVKATMQMRGELNINDDISLEHEADVMGNKALQFKASSKGSNIESTHVNTSVVQRLALKYGNGSPIPADAKKIADAQNIERGAAIEVQDIPGAISEDVFTAMANREKVYIVAHGRAPIGNEPAVLQEGGDGVVLSGGEVAKIINNIKTGLEAKEKVIGEVKIEACMSSLSRKTERGLFGETFVTAKPSLLSDIQSSLLTTYKVNNVTVQGNPGFSTGNEFEEGGVGNLSPENTELGLLGSILEILYDAKKEDWSNPKNTALKKDGLNIVKKYGTQLANFDKTPSVGELIKGTSASLFNNYLNGKAQSDELKGEINSLVSVLNGYIRKNPK